MGRAARLRILAALLLSAATLAFFSWDGRFRVGDADVLTDADFADRFRHWAGTPGYVGTVREMEGAVVLLAGGRPRMTYLGQTVAGPLRFGHYRVSLDVRLEGVVPRAVPWQRAGVVLRSYDAAGRRLRHVPYLVMEAAGTADWHRVARTIPVPDDARTLSFVVYNAGSAGELWVRDLRLEGLVETRLGTGLHYALMAGWAALIISAAAGLLGAGRPFLRWGLLGLAAFILAGTIAPQPGLSYAVRQAGGQAVALLRAGADLVRPQPPPKPAPAETAETPPPAVAADEAEQRSPSRPPPPPQAPPGAERPRPAPEAESAEPDSGREEAEAPDAALLSWFNAILYEGRPILGLGASSFAHLAAYFVFAFLSVFALAGMGAARLAGYLLVAAGATEVLQSFQITRGVQAGDLAFNVAGIAAGLIPALLVARLARRRA